MPLPRLTAGKRNLLGRIARSRAARDMRRAGRVLSGGWMVVTIAVGSWVILEGILNWFLGK